MVESPRLYISNYFSELRRTIDLQYFQKELKTNIDKKIWLEMIQKCEDFERKCLKAKQQKDLAEMDDEEIKKRLFLNQTIFFFVDTNQAKLVRIVDEFLSDRSIQLFFKRLKWSFQIIFIFI